MDSQTAQTVKDHLVVHVDPILDTLVPRFLENRARDVHALRGALEDGDYHTIQSIGHAMKGTGGGYGFDAISAMGGDLEEAGKSSDGPGAQQLIRALDGIFGLSPREGPE